MKYSMQGNSKSNSRSEYDKLPIYSSKEKNSVYREEESGMVFDAGRIIDHYRDCRNEQHQQLASSNLKEELKQLLFGFPSKYFVRRKD